MAVYGNCHLAATFLGVKRGAGTLRPYETEGVDKARKRMAKTGIAGERPGDERIYTNQYWFRPIAISKSAEN